MILNEFEYFYTFFKTLKTIVIERKKLRGNEEIFNSYIVSKNF